MPEIMLGNRLVEPETGAIRRDGEAMHLEPKSMAVLLHLIERHGEVVSRDELLEAIWPAIHVGDDSLTAAIIKIRRALGDDARDPRYIETIPKRGYRLIAAPRAPDAAPTGVPEVGTVSRKLRLGGAAVLVLVIAAAGLLWRSGGEAPGSQPVPPSGGLTVIAVAPFANISGDPTQDYLAQGIGGSILNDLAHRPGLSVRQLPVSGQGVSAPDYILQGSVLRVGDKIRVDARLVDAERGEVLAVQRFDRAFSDLLTVEDEIRDTVLEKLAGSIGTAEKSRRARGYTDNVKAYDLFLRAQRSLLVRTADTNLVARDLYRQAIVADPDFARAYGGLALTHAADYRNGWAKDRGIALDSAMKFAQTAIGISPDLPEQHWVIGYVLTQQRRFAEARAELQNVVDLDPGFADAFALMGGIETYRGNPEASVPLLREAMRLNPDAGYLYFLLLARAYYFLGDFEQAEINLVEALARNPENVEAHLYLAASLLHLGREDDAAWEAVEVMSVEPAFSLQSWSDSYPMGRGAQLDRLLSDLRLAGFS